MTIEGAEAVFGGGSVGRSYEGKAPVVIAADRACAANSKRRQDGDEHHGEHRFEHALRLDASLAWLAAVVELAHTGRTVSEGA
ncbi:MAG: hypothetical protein ACLR3C_13765 [Eggerthella lenta]